MDPKLVITAIIAALAGLVLGPLLVAIIFWS